MTRTNLYELTAEWLDLEADIIEAGGVLDEELEKRLDAIEGDREAKFRGYYRLIRELEARGAARAAEGDRLKALAKTDENAIKSLKGRLVVVMGMAGDKRVDFPEGRITRVRNSSPSVDLITDLDKLPDDFIERPEPVVPEPRLSRDRVLEAIKAGEEVPEGIRVEYGEHVRLG